MIENFFKPSPHICYDVAVFDIVNNKSKTYFMIKTCDDYTMDRIFRYELIPNTFRSENILYPYRFSDLHLGYIFWWNNMILHKEDENTGRPDSWHNSDFSANWSGSLFEQCMAQSRNVEIDGDEICLSIAPMSRQEDPSPVRWPESRSQFDIGVFGDPCTE